MNFLSCEIAQKSKNRTNATAKVAITTSQCARRLLVARLKWDLDRRLRLDGTKSFEREAEESEAKKRFWQLRQRNAFFPLIRWKTSPLRACLEARISGLPHSGHVMTWAEVEFV